MEAESRQGPKASEDDLRVVLNLIRDCQIDQRQIPAMSGTGFIFQSLRMPLDAVKDAVTQLKAAGLIETIDRSKGLEWYKLTAAGKKWLGITRVLLNPNLGGVKNRRGAGSTALMTLTNRIAILEYLEKGGWHTIAEISLGTEISKQYSRILVNRLLDEGLVDVQSVPSNTRAHGPVQQFRITPTGTTAIAQFKRELEEAQQDPSQS